MAEVTPVGTNRIRVFNPTNPKRKKPWTQRQAAQRKDQAERFVRDVIEDDERADEIAALSPEEYAAERGKEIVPNHRRSRTPMKRKTSSEQQQPRDNPVEKALETTTRLAEEQGDLYRRIRELETKNDSLQDKLDEISDIVECDDDDCDDADHLDAIAEVLNGPKAHGPRHGRHDDAGED